LFAFKIFNFIRNVQSFSGNVKNNQNSSGNFKKNYNYKDNINLKSYKLRLSIFEYIFPNFFFKKSNRKIGYFDNLCTYIKEKLSIEKILNANLKNDIFQRIILNEKELELFDNIPKLKLNFLEKIHSDSIRNSAFNFDKFLTYNKIEKNQRINKILEYFIS